MNHDEMARLEQRVDQLLSHCQQLRKENEALKSENKNLLGERVRLVDKAKLARNRIESMIGRLKTLQRA